MGWEATISSTPVVENAWRSIRAIATDVLKRFYPATNVLPLERHVAYEEAILFAYMARCTGEAEWGQRCVERLNDAIEENYHRTLAFSLFGGLSGLGWTVEHVQRILGETLNNEECRDKARKGNVPDEDQNEETDSALIQRLQMPVQRGQFDLIHGLVGYGIYFLERWPQGHSAEGLGLVIDALERISEDKGSGTTWYSTPETIPESDRKQCPWGYYNLGVAHGVPGVVQFLYQVSQAGIEAQKVLSLLDRTLTWLIAQTESNSANGLRFGSWITPRGNSRLARPTWCYGDLGIAAVLFQVGDGMGNRTLKKFASDMFENCLKLPFELYRIEDAGLCHGATGVAHIYNRMYQLGSDRRFRDAALNWYDRALAFFSPGYGVGGYCKRVRREGEGAWEPWPAFLDGSIGIALALLGAVTSVEPQWDRALLLSSRFSQAAERTESQSSANGPWACSASQSFARSE